MRMSHHYQTITASLKNSFGVFGISDVATMIPIAFAKGRLKRIIMSQNNIFLNKYFKRQYGFNSAQEALAHCNNTDFVDRDDISIPAKENVYDIMISYLYQDGSWVINKGNEDFMIFFGRDLKSDLNGKYFKDLLTVPTK